MRFTFSTQIGAMLAQVFSPDGKSVAIFDATDPPEVANARAASMALLLNGGVPKQEQPEAVQVPQGWRLVPEEPTTEMLDAVAGEPGEDMYETMLAQYRDDWSAMLAAAPQPPAQAEPDKQLCTFFGVDGFPELVAAMERHIERLQAKLPKDNQAPLTRVREG